MLRARKDPRARKSLLVRGIFLLYMLSVFGYYGYSFYGFHDPATAIGMAVVLVVILMIAGAVRFAQWSEAQKILREDIASTLVEVTAEVQRLAHGLAAVTQRALGERWLRHNVVPEGHTVITRRIQLETLREKGVWDEMPTEVRAWMMSPDGSWPDLRVAHVLSTGETLNTLLWALALQKTLRPVEDLLTTLSMNQFASALERPASGLRPTWDLRVERNRAFQYFGRCHAERVHRGEVDADNDEQAAAIRAWMAEVTERPSEDVLAGAATIRELDDDSLRIATFSAAYRAVTLGLLIDLLDGADVHERLASHVYVSLLLEHEGE